MWYTVVTCLWALPGRKILIPKDDSFEFDHQYCALEENISEASLHTTTACKGVPDEMEVVASLKTPETASGKHQVLVPKGRSLIIYRTRQGHVTMELSAGFKVADRLVRRHLGDFFHVPDDQGIRQWIKKAFQRRTSNTKCAARILALFMPSSHGVEIPLVYNPSTFEPFVWIIMVSNSGWYFSSFWKLGTLIQATRLPGNKLLVPKVDTRRHVIFSDLAPWKKTSLKPPCIPPQHVRGFQMKWKWSHH